MQGTVRSFVAEKKFGFIDGDDGNSYFVHVNEIRNHLGLLVGQKVEFTPFPSPKGLKARDVIPGPSPELIYVDPDKFIMTREDHVRGCETVALLGRCWGESNDPNLAREQLKGAAIQQGANAVVSMDLEKYTKEDGCSNYRYTMHRFCGDAVIVKRTEFSSDPGRIQTSQAQMQWIRGLSRCDSIGSSQLIRPHFLVFYPKLALSWTRTLTLIVCLIPIALICKAFSIRPRFLYRTNEALVQTH